MLVEGGSDSSRLGFASLGSRWGFWVSTWVGRGGGAAAASVVTAPLNPWFDGIGGGECVCAFVVSVVVLVAAFPDGVGLRLSCHVTHGRRWWVVRTRCCVVRRGLDSEVS